MLHSALHRCSSRLILAFILGVSLVGGLGSQANADNFSFNGSFTQDNSVQLFNFSVGALSTVTVRTYSYAGGMNAAGTLIAGGGFDPILALFDATNRIAQNDDGGSNVPADATTGQRYDTFLQVALGAGNYTVSVMQYDNFSIGPNFFAREGQPNFTSAFGCSNGTFCDSTGANRTNQWAFDVLNVASATELGVPGPIVGAGLPGLVLACGGVLGWWRRKQKAESANA